MITAATSAETEVSEDLLTYFVDIGNKECFAAMLYICFDLLREDVIEELSWQHGLNDFYMPYKIQKKRSLIERVRITYTDPISELSVDVLSRLLHLRSKCKSSRGRSLKRSSKKLTLPSSTPGSIG